MDGVAVSNVPVPLLVVPVVTDVPITVVGPAVGWIVPGALVVTLVVLVGTPVPAVPGVMVPVLPGVLVPTDPVA